MGNNAVIESPAEEGEKDLDVELRQRYNEIQKAANYSKILIDFGAARRYLWGYKSNLDDNLWKKLSEQEIEAACGSNEDKANFRKLIYDALVSNPNVPQNDILREEPYIVPTRDEETKDLISRARQYVFVRSSQAETEEEKSKWADLTSYLFDGEKLLNKLSEVEPNWQTLPLIPSSVKFL